MRGYVLANGIESNGRLLGLVYAGDTDIADGHKPFVDNDLLDLSINAQLVVAGLAYVEPYDTMPMSLVRHMRQVIGATRQAGGGLFAQEHVNTANSAQIADLGALEGLIMWPKLYRRLSAYFSEGHAGLGNFDNWIRQDPVHRDDTLRLPDGEKGNMHDAYIVNGDSLGLQFNPEDLLIEPDPSP
jgi:hypothetical protein